jgi:chloramphenicol-sensitive protein RarD
MVFLGEKLNRSQKIATAVGSIAVIVLTVDYGRPPLVALTLAASFGFYGLAKSKLGGQVSPVISYSIESGVLLPVAILQLALVGLTQPGITFASQGFWGIFGLVMFGFFTAIPLILFGSAAKRLQLKYVGFIQYLTPILQFSTAYFLFHEPMPPARWIGFILVWASLAVLSADALRGIRRREFQKN